MVPSCVLDRSPLACPLLLAQEMHSKSAIGLMLYKWGYSHHGFHSASTTVLQHSRVCFLPARVHAWRSTQACLLCKACSRL